MGLYHEVLELLESGVKSAAEALREGQDPSDLVPALFVLTLLAVGALWYFGELAA